MPRRNTATTLTAVPAAILLALGACGGESGTGPDTPSLDRVEVDFDATFFLTGDVDTVDVRAVDSGGSALAGATFEFTSSDPAVARVDATGVVTALAPGTATIEVEGSASGETARSSVDVRVARGAGARFPGLLDIDRAIVDWMASTSVPGAVLAVTKDGALVYARGYGIKDVEVPDEPVLPTSIFRLGSVSKPIAGVAVLRAVQDGLLTLEDTPYPMLLTEYDPLPGEEVDPRLLEATVDDLLRHQTGWGADRAVDGRVWEAWWRHGADAREAFRYGLGFTPVAAPGEIHAYTNYDTQTLALLLEQVTGTEYTRWVRSTLLGPAGADSFQYGHSRERAPGEVEYHGPDGQPNDFLPNELEYADASGRWIATAPDLLRFTRAIEGLGGTTPLLDPTRRSLLESRNETLWPNDDYYAGLHWYIQTTPAGKVWRHAGEAPGHYSLLVRRPDGVAFAFFINRRRDWASNEQILDVGSLIDGLDWPDVDLFAQY